MTRTAVYSRQAERDLRGLERTTVQRILRAIRNYTETSVGDVRTLRGHRSAYRLRVGVWRVLFDSDQPLIRFVSAAFSIGVSHIETDSRMFR